MICLATVQNRGKDTHYGFYVVDVSRSAGGRVFLFSWERLTIVSSKAVPIRGFGYEK